MEQSLINDLSKLKQEVDGAIKTLNIGEASKKLKELQAQSESSDFWQDNQRAQSVMKEIAKLNTSTEPWLKLQSAINDIDGLNKLNDASMSRELSEQLKKLSDDFAGLKKQLKFSGPYDDHDVFMYIFAGAGGTDAQDWAEMLLRMYSRWAEKNGYNIDIIAESSGEEAGIKSATVEISGPYAYGKLKGEHGVHRLVRLSPFNSDNLRQTSFAKVDILPKIDSSTEVNLDEKEIKTDVFRSGGHGGQSVNTTDSAVRVTHLPSGISVVIQNERSQLQNKALALSVLRSRLAQLQIEQHTQRLSEIKGPNKSAEWGSQIRSYVLHPYKQVKDLRTNYKTNDPDSVLDGQIDSFIEAYSDTNIDLSTRD
jgi:peptide chain release factor 2